MTDEERNIKIEAIKQRTLAQLFGQSNDVCSDADEIEFRDVDKNWNSGKSWMEQIRITTPMNNDMTGLAEFNEQTHLTKGKVVTIMRDKPDMLVAPIK